jgi:hypothetical protein
MTEQNKRGSNGGAARKAKLSPERRREIAKQAAAKRWAKKDEPKPLIDPEITKEVDYLAAGIKKSIVDILHENGLRTDDEILVAKPPSNAPLLISGPTMTVPFIYREEPKPTPPEPPKAVQKRRKPMVKEFGKAYSRAEKLLEEALKKRSEAVKIIIACNEDIPMYVNVIKSLGGTVDPQAMRAVDIRSLDSASPAQNMNFYQPPQYQQPQTAPIQDVNPIDPALYATNANPVPGLSPAIANAPVVLNKPLGGAIDLGYTPVDEEAGPGLPNMGGGWA